MKKTYQKPEAEIVVLQYENILGNEMSPGEIGSGNTLTNENHSFEENEEATPTSSSLWD